MTLASPLLALWGKARPRDGSRARCHPLLYHCLDVAAVGEALLAGRPDLLDRLARRLEGEPRDLSRLILFLLALHDIGKISRPFQAKAPEHWPAAVLGPLSAVPDRPRHDAAGLALLLDEVPDALEPVLGGLRSWQPLLAPFMGHHGRPVAPPDCSPTAVFGEPCRAQARAFVATMRDLLAPGPVPAWPKAALARVSWPLAGLAILADWIGSAQAWFPYEPPERDAGRYWHEVARPRARDALAAARLGSAHAVAPVTGFRAVTGIADPPSAVQRWAEEAALPGGALLALVEEVTGGGKTEAALVLAHRLMAAGRAKGLFIALPTMATANAMFERVREGCGRLFAAGESPTLVLAHGRGELHPGFRELRLSFPAADGGEDERDGAGAVAPAWLADDRRKAFLADLGVGTIDQALLAVLTARHQSLRLLGLADKVLIVDEAHACDAYMQAELKRLLEFQAAQGGSAIVLSATLPLAMRQELAAAFAAGLGGAEPSLRRNDYPLVTLVSAEGVAEEPKAHRPDLGRELRIERLASTDAAHARVMEAAQAGAAVAWIRNTVDDAVEAFERLQAAGVPTDLFHARFALGDRLAVEQRVVRRFGKHGDPAGRPGVLVATQVVEQSLDLDFDLMVSDLAPVDLLLQRAGRLWRHRRRARPVAGPRLLVLSPDPDAPVTRDWLTELLPRAGWVYRNHALLWRSAREILARGTVRVPQDVRGLVEAVYGETAEASAPEALARCWIEAAGADQAARAVADMNLLSLAKGYDGAQAGWADDMRVATRLGEPSVTLRLARFEAGKVEPWCPDPDPARAWALSEVTMRASRVKGVPEPGKDRRAAVEAAKGSWSRHDADKPLLILDRTDLQCWNGVALNQRGQEVQTTYNDTFGLRFA